MKWKRENKIANGMNMTSEKKAKEIYWAMTARFAMMLTGVMLLAGVASNVEGITHLLWTVSDSKRMGLCGIYVQRLGASHAFYGDPFIKIMIPIIILAFVLASYRLWKNSLVSQAVQGA